MFDSKIIFLFFEPGLDYWSGWKLVKLRGLERGTEQGAVDMVEERTHEENGRRR